MNLEHILQRFATGLMAVDQAVEVGGYNRRTGELYLPGVKTLTERDCVSQVRDWWARTHPEDFDGPADKALAVEVPYPFTPRAKLDLLIADATQKRVVPQWAIEVKHIALVGNNGKNNDFNVTKMLSPYLKDRSLMHDITRLKSDPFCANQAVIGYSFDYSFDTLTEASRVFPHESETLGNIRDVCQKVDATSGRYSVNDLVDFADSIFASRDYVFEAQRVPFGPTWKHPAGGYGWVFGWQIKQGKSGHVQ